MEKTRLDGQEIRSIKQVQLKAMLKEVIKNIMLEATPFKWVGEKGIDQLVQDSSNIKKIEYDEDLQDLYITFKSGGRYVYADVPLKVIEKLRKAPSLGKFFHKIIKPKYIYTKVSK